MKIYDTGEHSLNSDVPFSKVINENKIDDINDDAVENEK